MQELSETIYFYFFALMLIVSSVGVIFSPRMFLSVFSLFGAFFFSSLLYELLNARFLAIFQFIFCGLLLCVTLFAVMQKISRWNLKLKVSSWLRNIVTCAALLLFVVLTAMFVQEEFSSSLFGIFSLTSERAADVLHFSDFIFPLYLICILFIAVASVIKTQIDSGTQDNVEEDCNG